MLGAQASLVVSLVSSIGTVLDTAAKLYNDVKDAENIPEAFCEGTRLLPIVQDALRNVQTRTGATGIDDEACREWQPILERCMGRALQLETLFRRVIPQANTSRHNRYLLIVNAPGKDSRVETEAQRKGIVQTELLHWLQNCETFERLRHFHNVFEKIPGLGCSEDVGPLYILSLHGCQELLRAVLYEGGVDVNARGGAYGGALQAAAFKGEEEIVKILLVHEADANAQGGLYGNALQAAACQGKEGITRTLLAHGAETNAQGGVYGSTLQAAVRQGKKEIVKMWLAQGADANAQGGPHGSALQAAVTRLKNTVVGLLLENGADVNAQYEPAAAHQIGVSASLTTVAVGVSLIMCCAICYLFYHV